MAEYRQLLESEDFGKLSERDYVLWEIDFADVFMGKGGFDIVIGNPPYVRQEEIGPPTIVDRPTTREERKAYKEKLIRSVQAFLGKDVKIDKKSDLYVYFYYLGMSLLNDNGVFVFITSNSWLDVGYGAGLQEWLLHNMEVKDIYDNQAKRSFKSADVNTVIVVFNKPEGDPLSHMARFTAFKKPFEEVLSSDTLLVIEDTKGIVSTDEFRVYQATQQDLLEEGFEKDKTQTELKKTIPLAGKYKGNKWGGKYLRAPDIYFKILEKAGDKLVRLGDIAEVRFGIKTGCNEFFYLDEGKIKEWGIEEEFLVPVIKSPRECKTILIEPEDLKLKVLMCHKRKKELRGTATSEYINWGELQGYHKRPSCRGRPRWWYLPKEDGNSFWGKEVREKIATYVSVMPIYVDCRLYCARIESWLQAVLNSSLTAFFGEIMSRSIGGGGGPRSMMVYEVQSLWVLRNSFGYEEDLKNVFKKMATQEIRPLIEAIEGNKHRRVLDKIIFDILRLTQGERDAVYEAVVELVSSRLEKARSI